MKIVLIGGSGFVGSAILEEALNRGHRIKAIARNTERIRTVSDRLIKVQADVMDTKALAELVKDNDVVVNAYNPGWENQNIYAEYLRGAQSIQEAVKRSGVKRLFVIGGAGSLFVAPNLQLIDTSEFPEQWKAGALAAREYLNIIKNEQDLDWTFLSPAIGMHQGTSGERRGIYREGLDSPVFDGNNRSIISVEDIAVAVMDELENPQHIRQRFTVAY